MTRCGDVIIIGIIGYKGPNGGPGMRETLSTASAIYGQGMSSQGALISEGRFSGATRGFCVAISDRKPLWVGRWRCWAMATTP